MIVSKYLGGVLASSRNPLGRDDRGVVYAELIDKLSSYQLRTHYLFYHIARELYKGFPVNIGLGEHRSRLKIFIPMSNYVAAMDFSKEERKLTGALMQHIMWGLVKENLILEEFHFGKKEYLSKIIYPNAKTSGIVFSPSALGIDLFFWAYGYADKHTNEFFAKNLKIPFYEGVKIKKGYKRIFEYDWEK